MIREIAVWDENPEDPTSREELATYWTRLAKFEASLSHRFYPARHRRKSIEETAEAQFIRFRR